MVATSLTQIESHFLLQQKESRLQMAVTHGSQLGTSLPPVVQLECEQLEVGGGVGAGGGVGLPQV
jgi:hypothetical protein